MSRPAQQVATEVPKDITMKALHKALKKMTEDDVIVDLRKPEDNHKGHIPGSKNMPYATVMDYVDDLRQYHNIYIHCYNGEGSKAIATRLSEMGFEHICYVGHEGIADWQLSGYRLEEHGLTQ